MALTGPHLIQDGRAVPLTAAQLTAMCGGQPSTAALRAPAPAVAAAPRQPAPPSAAAPPKPQPTPEETRAARRTANLQRVARMGGPDGAEAKRILAQDAAAAGEKAEADALAALPKTLEEAQGDGRALMRADMQRRVAAKAGKGPSNLARESMARSLRAKGIEPRKG